MYPSKLTKTVLVLFLLFLLIAGLILAKEFLLPITFGLLVSMLLLKRVSWLEKKGLPRWLSILICIVVLLALVSTVVFLIVWQITDLESEIAQFNRTFAQLQRDAKAFIRETLGLSWRDANELVSNAAQKDKAPEVVAAVLKAVTSIFTFTLLTIVYVFLFLYFRTHLKKFILKIVPAESRENTNTIIKESIKVSHGYLSGMAKMIVCLWILYSVGFSIAGINYAIMFAVICGLLEIIPFVGNVTGTSLTIIMALIQGGGMGMVLTLVAVYGVVQFVQTYFLEPLVVGSEVNLNPLFTIVALVLGELLWGIPGMIVAIPMLGIVKIVFDNIEELKPYGFLLGQERPFKKSGSILSGIKKLF